MPVIRISDEVFRRLQDEARELQEPFVSPDNLLRYLLKMPQTGTKKIGRRSEPCTS